jgi:2-oxoisovalerate dehydrogenase E1 component
MALVVPGRDGPSREGAGTSEGKGRAAAPFGPVWRGGARAAHVRSAKSEPASTAQRRPSQRATEAGASTAQRRPSQRATEASCFRGFPVAEVLEDYRMALISRAIDDREITLQKHSRAFFHISGAGHEALCLGLARYLKPGYDWFFPYYRDRALALALGVTPVQLLLQAVGAATDPASGGRQMPSHFSDRHLNIVTQSSPTGSQCIPAVGCAEGGRYIWQHREERLPGCTAQEDEVIYVSVGDGATSQGEFWESLNTACNLRLPVLYVVADNGYAISVPLRQQSPAPISELVKGFPNLATYRLDGCDYFEVRTKAPEIVSAIRRGQGPALVHATVTRPYSHSSADTQSKYRPKSELEEEAWHDPIAVFERALAEGRLLSPSDIAAMREEARQAVAEAAREALAAPRPDPATVADHVWALPVVKQDEANEAHAYLDEGQPKVPLGEAIRLGLHEAMAKDARVRVFGEDVADAPPELLDELEGKGGVFGTTFGLQRKFGSDRVFNTPLSEANIVGRAVGQGLRGLRPVPEIQFFDYIWTAMQQIRSEASTIRWRSAGEWSCPMVLRVPIGGYLAGGAIWHSQSGVSIFAHIPGIIIVMPSRAVDAVGLLRTAFEAEDPVMFLEHKHLLRQRYTMTPYPASHFRIPFGKGRVVTTGRNLTIVTYGATVEKSLQAAARTEASVEVIDLRSLKPWDRELVAESVAKTGRVLVVSEDNLTCGFGAEVAAWIGEHCFSDLDVPVSRVGAADTNVPYEPGLERAVLPQVEGIEAACRRLLEA